VPAELRSRSLKTTRWNVRHLALVPRVAVTVGAPEGDLLPSQWAASELVSRSQRAGSHDRAQQKLSPPTVFPATITLCCPAWRSRVDSYKKNRSRRRPLTRPATGSAPAATLFRSCCTSNPVGNSRTSDCTSDAGQGVNGPHTPPAGPAPQDRAALGSLRTPGTSLRYSRANCEFTPEPPS
jgi:hypothetical protein